MIEPKEENIINDEEGQIKGDGIVVYIPGVGNCTYTGD